MAGLSATNGESRVSLDDKLFYKIGEVSRITGLPSYVLRFWESERFFRSNGCATSRDLPLKDFVAVGIPDKGPRNEGRRARPRKSYGEFGTNWTKC